MAQASPVGPAPMTSRSVMGEGSEDAPSVISRFYRIQLTVLYRSEPWARLLLAIQNHQLVGDGEERKLQPRGDAGLVEDVREMAPHRFFAAGELLGAVR